MKLLVLTEIILATTAMLLQRVDVSSACKSHATIANEIIERHIFQHREWLQHYHRHDEPYLVPYTIKYRKELTRLEVFYETSKVASGPGRRPNHDARIAHAKRVTHALKRLRLRAEDNAELAREEQRYIRYKKYLTERARVEAEEQLIMDQEEVRKELELQEKEFESHL